MLTKKQKTKEKDMALPKGIKAAFAAVAGALVVGGTFLAGGAWAAGGFDPTHTGSTNHSTTHIKPVHPKPTTDRPAEYCRGELSLYLGC